MSYARKEYTDFEKLAPDAFAAVRSLGQFASKVGLDRQMLELVKLRASQINGCAFCVQFHILQGESLGGARRRNSQTASARRWRGPKR